METIDYDKYRDACCYMSPRELMEYVKEHKERWGNINSEDIKQIEALFVNDVYVLSNNGNVYMNGALILGNIKDLWCMNIKYMFFITIDNYIFTLEDNTFNDYIGGIQYRKIVKSRLDILALTIDNRLKALTSFPEFIGIVPENFIDVEDITINGELGTPFIIKNNKKIPLYVSDYNESK